MNTHTFQSTSLVTFMLTAAIVAPFASAQSGSPSRPTPAHAGQPRGTDSKESQHEIQILSHDKIVGSKLYLARKGDRSYDEKSRHDERSGDRPDANNDDRSRRDERSGDRPNQDQTRRDRQAGDRDAGQSRDDDESCGHITDLVIDRESGKLEFAVVASNTTFGFGGESRLIDWRQISWKTDSNRCTLDLTAEEFANQPRFDQDDLQRSIRAANADSSQRDARREDGVLGRDGRQQDGIQGRDGRQQDGDQVGRGRDQDRNQPGRRTDDDPRGNREFGASEASYRNEDQQHKHMLVSNVTSTTVMAQGTKIGTASAVLLEPNHACAAFLTAGTGGVLGFGETDRPIPWSALRWTLPAGDSKLTININKTESQLKSAPKLGDEGVDLNQKRHRQTVYEFYGVEMPKFETEKPHGQKEQGHQGQPGKIGERGQAGERRVEDRMDDPARRR